MKRPTWIAAGLLVAGALLPASARADVKARDPELLRLVDVAGHPVAPFADSSCDTVVVLFVRTDCPVSKRYAPEIERLYEAHRGDRMAFWLAFCDPDEAAPVIRAHLDEYGYHVPALRDSKHELVAAAGATVTPEAAVFVRGNGGWRLVYRGRIDDRYASLGRSRPAATVHDLEDVLRELALGNVPEPRFTTAIGCFIADLK